MRIIYKLPRAQVDLYLLTFCKIFLLFFFNQNMSYDLQAFFVPQVGVKKFSISSFEF